MTFFSTIWKRVFFCSIILVIVTMALGQVFFYFDMQRKSRDMVLHISEDIHEQMDNLPLDSVRAILNVFNKKENKLWLEAPGGELLAGERPGGKTGEQWKKELKRGETHNGITIWNMNDHNALYLVETPLSIEGRKVAFFNYFVGPKGPPWEVLIFHHLFIVICIASVLALWMSFTVSRPLRKLQKELTQSRESGSVPKVTVRGKDEIADVARAINDQGERLLRYLTGMRELLVNISHEIRSPLARMSLSLAMVEEGLGAAYEEKAGSGAEQNDRKERLALAAKHLDALQEELVHMDKLLETILQANRLELQDRNSFTELVSLSNICGNTARRYEETFRHAGISFTYEIAEDLYAFGDGTLLVQLLSNLLDNAAKYAFGPEKQVRLELYKKRSHAVITVENSYPKIDSDTLENIFEPFYRAEHEEPLSVGLGLSLVRKIATLHGGGAMAVSTDMGICMYVQLAMASRDEPLVVFVDE